MTTSDIAASAEMAAFCLQTILARLRQSPLPSCPPSIPNVLSPIFVTLKEIRDDALRGCIGNFSPSPLHEQLTNYAIAAAFEDHRFTPVRLEELPGLACTVSLLHNFEPCRAWDDWVVGTHGIRIRYRDHAATYLPSVAMEQGWDHRQTLDSLLAKGGYRGVVDTHVLAEVKVTRYQVSLATVSFEESKLSIN